MALRETSPLLALPQELRDLIYKYALDEVLPWPSGFQEWSKSCSIREDDRDALPTDARHDTNGGLIFHFPAHGPRPAWYNLLLCCRTTNKDIRQIVSTTALNQVPSLSPAVLDLSITSTTATTTWQRLPCHPQQISTLQINIRLAHLWDTGIISGAPQSDNKIIRALFRFLQQYCKYGPHFSRKTPLARPLQLNTALLTVEPAFSTEESEYFFGNPSQQLATVSGVLMIWLGRLARSGLLSGSLGKIVWDCDYVYELTMGKEPLVFKVTGHPWDQADQETFRSLGYEWD
ncbi:hypothetical protein Slin14017_G103160 [Septoria linicola]|nr:hypothetical protein Slin14017_G103160 [Septoria linicola]